MYSSMYVWECRDTPPLYVFFEKSSVVKRELNPEGVPFMKRSPMSENKL